VDSRASEVLVRRAVVLFVLALLVVVPAPLAAAGDWSWPVTGPVIRGFDRPDSPYGSGHRGIDIAASVGTTVVAAAAGVVAFAGPVGGELFVSVDHGGGVVSSYSFLSTVGVRKGQLVAQDAPVGLSGAGHPGITPAHLHLGVRVNGEYADPLDLLSPPNVVALVRLAPLDAG
jgi:murein DD-endopeptidase MepM/ murein hydrolase activator NlpD